jgi:hypothetical protein
MKTLGRSLAVVILVLLHLSFPSNFAVAAPGTYSFTTAGSSGYNGPTQESVTASYAGTNLASQVMVVGQGIQLWTIPVSDTYSVTVAGASGGYVPLRLGGQGRVITIEKYFTAGQSLKILVGQEGGRIYFTTGYAGGGGGGSFVIDSATSQAIVVAGGGGGSAQSSGSYSNPNGVVGSNASAYTSTAGTAGGNGGLGGTAGGGGGGNGAWCGGSGGGFTGNGTDSGGQVAYGGKSFSNGGSGGANGGNSLTTNIAGGFGGGGGAQTFTSYETNGGGGGGYSGGGCGKNAYSATGPGGGGGGNFYTGTYVSNSLNTGNGFVTFTRMNLITATLALSTPKSATYRIASTITATSNSPGTITFFEKGKRIPGCINQKTQSSGSNYIATCSWRPTLRGAILLTASIVPTGDFIAGSSTPFNVSVSGRSNPR